MVRCITFRAVRWLMFAGISWVVIYGAWYAIRDARRSALRMQRSNNLKQIGLGLHNFHDVYKRLPAVVKKDKAGRPLGSWRFQLIHFLEAMMLGVEFSDRWDDPGNRWLMLHHCYCWNPNTDFPENAETNVLAISGPGTAFEADKVIRLSDMDDDTILAIEVANSDILWLEPGDLLADEVNQTHLQGLDGTGTHVLFKDGTVWFLKAGTPLEELQHFLTIEGAKQYDRDQILGQYLAGNRR